MQLAMMHQERLSRGKGVRGGGTRASVRQVQPERRRAYKSGRTAVHVARSGRVDADWQTHGVD